MRTIVEVKTALANVDVRKRQIRQEMSALRMRQPSFGPLLEQQKAELRQRANALEIEERNLNEELRTIEARPKPESEEE